MKFVVLFAILIVTAAASPQLIPSTSLSSGSTSFVSVVNDAIKSAADILTEASKSVESVPVFGGPISSIFGGIISFLNGFSLLLSLLEVGGGLESILSGDLSGASGVVGGLTSGVNSAGGLASGIIN